LYTVYIGAQTFYAISHLGGNNKQGDLMWRRIIYALSLVTQLGLSTAVNAGLGWWIGLWLDARFGRNMFFSLIGLVLGLISGLSIAYQLLRRALVEGGFEDG
jgi:hypothetical protein